MREGRGRGNEGREGERSKNVGRRKMKEKRDEMRERDRVQNIK